MGARAVQRETEGTHVKEHVLVLYEELGEQAQVLAVELMRRISARMRMVGVCGIHTLA